MQDFGIEFNSLYTLYNNPMGRFGAFLRKSGNLNRLYEELFDAFNADTVEALMCRTQLSVDYDGQLYDCDFNLAAGMLVNGGQTIFDVDWESHIQVRKIGWISIVMHVQQGRFQLRRRNELAGCLTNSAGKKRVCYVTLMQ